MGTLTPGATYIYERVAGTIFAREIGKTERRVVGYETDLSPVITLYRSQMNQILLMCESDPAMRDLLDQLVMLYNLKREHKEEIMWHPV